MATILMILVIGLSTGVLSGLFGIGGGVVMVPAMVLLLSYPQKTATGTSLAALVLPVALLGVIEYAKAGHVELRTAALLAAGIFVGTWVGARVAIGSSDTLLRRLFALVLVLTAVRLAFART